MKLPPMRTPSLGERWCIKVRTAPVCRREVVLEAMLSCPIPGLQALHFFHSVSTAEPGVMRILTRLTARLPSLDIVEFHQAPEDLFPGLPLEVSVSRKAYDEETRVALLACLPALTRLYPAQPAGALGPQFVEALEVLSPAELMPYFVALNPHFFEWCAA